MRLFSSIYLNKLNFKLKKYLMEHILDDLKLDNIVSLNNINE